LLAHIISWSSDHEVAKWHSLESFDGQMEFDVVQFSPFVVTVVFSSLCISCCVLYFCKRLDLCACDDMDFSV
jgi:hypothetical protein